MSERTTLVWFRQDLRIADNPALYHAVERSAGVVPVFIWAPDEEGDWPPGAAQQWYLHHSLDVLAADLNAKGSRLILQNGPSLAALRALIEVTGADAVYWNTRYEPTLRRRDADIALALEAEGIAVQQFPGRLLHDPEGIETTGGGPYQVFTPYWKKLQAVLDVADPLPKPRMGDRLAPANWPDSLMLNDLGLLPTPDWADGLRDAWRPGEDAAHAHLATFIADGLLNYEDTRNRPDVDGTSRLSPRLHHGELSPRQVWAAVNDWVQNGAMRAAADVWLRQMAWREFSYHLLYHFPDTPTEPLKQKFEAFPWHASAENLNRWQRGQTGYPIVDAGMRQLWRTGWMHNRVRMIVASFLTKDLLIPWQEGARWFWDTLVDGDLANNTMGWQWSAGSGADAQPFFRVFNPITQSKRFDPNGDYLRANLPELRALPNRYLHTPWTAPDDVLAESGITLGDTYPHPIVEHAEARDRALDAYQAVR